MSERSIEHGSFTIERSYEAAPARVFAAWSSAQAKAKWFGPQGDGGPAIELDFQVGGHERFAAEGPDGASYVYSAVYKDIVNDERIVYTYEMYRDEQRMSVSVASIELTPADGGCTLKMTEQGAFLDGQDTNAQREHGTRAILEGLADALPEG